MRAFSHTSLDCIFGLPSVYDIFIGSYWRHHQEFERRSGEEMDTWKEIPSAGVWLGGGASYRIFASGLLNLSTEREYNIPALRPTIIKDVYTYPADESDSIVGSQYKHFHSQSSSHILKSRLGTIVELVEWAALDWQNIESFNI